MKKRNLTKRTHYNPCFWTALWNNSYYQISKSFDSSAPSCREQEVIFLELNSDKVLKQKVENVFFEKGLGLINFTSEELKAFESRYYPTITSITENIEKRSNFTWDFENHFSKLEELPPYSVLLKVAHSGKIKNSEEKIYLGLFLILHQLRNHIFTRAMLELGEKMESSKLEHFMYIRWMLTDENFMMKVLHPIINSDWTIHRSSSSVIPLTDSPVTNNEGSIICPLSPNLVLEVDMTKQNNGINYTDLSPAYFDQVKKRQICNTYRGLVFTTEEQAMEWKSSKEWQMRRELIINNRDKINRKIFQNSDGQLWQLLGLANRLTD